MQFCQQIPIGFNREGTGVYPVPRKVIVQSALSTFIRG